MYLFKRSIKPTAPWYVKFSIRGRQHLWSTKTPDMATARRRGKDYREALIAEEFALADKMKARSTVISYQEVVDKYLDLPLKAGDNSRSRNMADLKAVLAASGIKMTDRLDTLSAKVAMVFQQAGLKLGRSPVTINSQLRCARSIFSKQAMVGYKAFGLTIRREWVEDFASVGYLPVDEHLPEIPTPEQMEAAHASLSQSPAVYRAFLLAAYAGMRAGEIEAALWGWLDGDIIYIGGREFAAKSGRWRSVRLAPEVLAKLGQVGAGGDFIVDPIPKPIVRRKLPLALYGVGFTSKTPVHSLRRLFGSQVAMASGLFAAQHALGHASPMTTSRHYARLLHIPAAVGITPAAPLVPAGEPAVATPVLPDTVGEVIQIHAGGSR